MTPEEEFNALPEHVLRLVQFYMEGGFGPRAADWLAMFNDYVDYTRGEQPIHYAITNAGRKVLEQGK